MRTRTLRTGFSLAREPYLWKRGLLPYFSKICACSVRHSVSFGILHVAIELSRLHSRSTLAVRMTC